ncbi:ABC transporter ATP-binding protein [Mycobacterium sp. KBS0706]|uniref:ABC transporter ATP-binding protein n=1 Tax=Mycobacterium sp. KBS0706 TaxID=2578109 RepID=UPI00110FD22D|nr:ABC transporter ATP-binding protein [Mycobacterium sp. KBS0706]TSD88784.1 ABC transporter ATP-binding protein [Mycobacterium sp. KBS0706]
MTATVQVSGLRVTARTEEGGEAVIVDDVGFTIRQGEVLALIGESGSGKTTMALATMGYCRGGCRITGGSVNVFGREILALDRKTLRGLRGRQIAYIAQSAAAAFNPSRSIMAQVIESALIHGTMPAEAARTKARQLFRELALPDPDRIGDRYPHQVSGGQLQRLMAAMALINDPELVIFDEPTTALDVTTQIEVLRAFKAVVRTRKTTGIYVSHDLAVVAQIADRIAVLRHGRLQETGPTERLVTTPEDGYTRQLIAAATPARRTAGEDPAPAEAAPLLRVEGLLAGFGAARPGARPPVTALQDIDLSIRCGRTLGVIGESGSGKSTLARVIAGLLPAARGRILLDGEALPATLQGRSRDQLRRIQIVFQNADTALNPARTVEQIIARPLAFYHGQGDRQRRQRLHRLLDLVRLPAAVADRLPGELSGGQKQRVNLARALAADPELILCDEVTSALDTVVGEAVLDLLTELQRELGVALMFISHDLGVVRSISHEVLVLRQGRTVEAGPTEQVLRAPQAAYTKLLLASVPELRPGWLDERARVVSAA